MPGGYKILTQTVVAVGLLIGAGFFADSLAASCSICHTMPPSDSAIRDARTGGTKGNHKSHQPPSATAENCAICHAGAETFLTGHRDGRIALVDNINSSPVSGRYVVEGQAVLFKNQTTHPQLGSCSSVNCHFENTTPSWGNASFSVASDCNKCHGAPPSDGSHPFGTQKHAVYYGTSTSSCIKCHPDHASESLPFAHATSAGNRELLVQFSSVPNNGFGRYTGNVSYPSYLPSQNPARNGACNNIYCHSPGTQPGGNTEAPKKSAKWGGSLDCAGCHDGAVLNNFMATGSHYAHVFGGGTTFSQIRCVRCHATTATAAMTIVSPARHVNGQVEVAFDSSSTAANGRYNGSVAKPSSPAVKLPGSAYGSCQNVYCHSSAQADGGGTSPSYSSPTWGNAASGKCGTCHGVTGSRDHGGFLDSMIQRRISTGSHKKHLKYVYGISDGDMRCAICHAYDKSSFNSANATCGPVCHTTTALRHSNYEINVNIANYFGASASYDGTTKPGAGYSTCSSVYCHSDGRSVPGSYAVPTWGTSASGACGTCHGATAASPPASPPHTKHVGNAAPYHFACAECHSGKVQVTSDSSIVPSFTNTTTHVNKVREVKFDASNPFGTYSSASSSCRNLYCHSTGNTSVASSSLPSVYGGKVYARVTWTGGTSCNSCHGRSGSNGMPDYSNAGSPGSATANSHQKHVASSNIACGECHEKTTKNGTSIRVTRPSLHTNGQPSVFFNLSGANRSGSYDGTLGRKTCASTYCHGTASSVSWGGATTCVSCHGAAFTTFSSTTKKGAHAWHIETDSPLPTSYSASGTGNLSSLAGKYQFGCASCHNPAKASHANAAKNSTGGAAEVFFGYTSSTLKGVYVPGTLQSGTDNGFTWTAGTGCNASYCHSNGQGGAGLVNVAWNAPKGSLGCNGCHGNGMSNPLSGKHSQHINPNVQNSLGAGNGFGCVQCHAKTVSNGTTISDKRYHVNKYIDYSGAKAGGSSRYNRATKQCTNLYCHSNGNPAAIAYVDPPPWNGTSTLGCNGCHGTTNPTTGAPDYPNGGNSTATANSHLRHVAGNGITDTRGCSYCHVKTVSQTVAGQFKDYTAVTYHLNGTPNVYFRQLAAKTGAWNGSTCTNTYCHGVNASAPWGQTASLACNSCHSAAATDAYWSANSAHKIHYASSMLPTKYVNYSGNVSSATVYRFTCSSCHDRGAVHAGGPANASGAAEVFFGYTTGTLKGSYAYGTTQGTSDNGFTWTNGDNCSTTYCHSNGQGGNGLVAVRWNTTGSSGTCIQCHDTKQTGATSTGLSGKHNAHMNPTGNASLGLGNGLNCRDCHVKTVSSNTSVSNKLKHVNKYIDYSGAKAGRYNLATKQCTNLYCHSNGKQAAIAYVNPPAWNSSSTLGCNGCHGTTNPSTGSPDYSNGGAGTATANSHYAHTRNASDTTVCASCHAKTVSLTSAGRFKDYTAVNYHLNGTPNVTFNPARAGASAAWNPATGQCSNVTCHGNATATWGSVGGGCLTCHSVQMGNRAAIGPQFSGNSHHVQGTTVTASHCYQCHWEANADGSINYAYHHSDIAGGPVELVVYGSGARPTSYLLGSTAVQYSANGTRSELAKINTHCLGCHSDANNGITPFGDGKTPKWYAWDGNSINARYGNTGTTRWGKYSSATVSRKNTVVKAFSAHGNALANHGGWNTSETWPDTRNGSSIVLCFDCHNAHGSSVSGTTTSYASATTNGGILKDISAGIGGYNKTYKPAGGGSVTNHNIYGAGAALCFDCHLNASASTTPWGYNATFGASQPILGFMDTPYFGTGTFPRQTMFSYKATPNMGGHFGASSALSITTSHSINGLCTPCHDPHGVSPSLGTNRVYAVPLLKGTWLTNPFKEDVAPATDENFIGIGAIGFPGEYEGPTRSQAKLDTQRGYMKSYKIDQNTFGPGSNSVMNSTAYGVSETDAQFAGLCLNCHAKSTLTNGTNHTWTSKDRIHESVKGWKTANTTIQHKFTCSKCHAPHNAGLPRLMVTNCLDSQHKGRVTNNASPVVSGSYRHQGYGAGNMPGSYSAHVGRSANWYNNQTFTCHENNDSTQKWNEKTKWNNTSGGGGSSAPSVPVLIAEPNTTCYTDCPVSLQWNPSTNPSGGTVQYQVQVSSSSTFATVNYTSSWITGTSVSVNLANGTWYWRVMARDAVSTAVSAWSAVDSFAITRY